MKRLTQDSLNEIFYYDGENLIRKVRTNNRVNIGDKVGHYGSHGYLQVGIYHRKYLVHRVIWVMIYGYWPTEIDHIDGNLLNNRLENLREVNHQKNSKNQKMPSSNTSGVTGVSLYRQTGKWRVQVHINGKKKNLGYFDDIEDAEQVALQAYEDNGYTNRHGK